MALVLLYIPPNPGGRGGRHLLMGREPSIQDHIVQSGIDTLIGENLRADTEDAMGQRQTPSLVEDFVNFLKNDRADYNTIQTQLQSLAPAKD